MSDAILRRCRVLLASALLCTHALLAHATPENGWWWNPAESGRGFFIEVQGNVLVMAAYFYEDDGRATWLLSAGPMAAPDSYNGRLLAFDNGQSLFGDYKTPAGPNDQGEITLVFTDDTHATLTWPGGDIPIERQVIGGRTPEFDPTGWWWNPAESGSGFSVEVRDATMFIAGFMYEDAGQPVWYISAGPMATSTRFEGTLLRVAGGQTLTGEYQAPTSSDAVATLAIEFASADDATITINDSGATAAASRRAVVNAPSSRSRIIVMRRQNPRPPPPRPPNFPAYLISLEGPIYRAIVSNNPIILQQATTVFESRRVVWLQTTNPDVPPLAPYNTPEWIVFNLYEGSAPLKVVYNEFNKACSTTGTTNDQLRASDGFLYLNLVTKEYIGEINKRQFAILNLTTVCPDLTYTQAKLFDNVGFKFSGTAAFVELNGHLYYNLVGREPRIIMDTIGFHTEVFGDWRFTQLP